MQRMLTILLISFSLLTARQDSTDIALRETKKQQVFGGYKQLLVNIREQTISRDSAEHSFQYILKNLHELYPFSKDDSSINDALVFPLRRSNWHAIGGTNGSGFRGKGFDLFDYNKKSSHPAHDIFIRDGNQDCIEDVYKTPVAILAVSTGLVIATETNWQIGSDYRGGNYVWLYDFKTGGLWYYAHQRKVIVKPGQRVEAGQKIGEVGRTGANAFQERSPTHLHIMYLRVDEKGLPHPENTFWGLKNAHTSWNDTTPAIEVSKDSLN